MVQNFKAVGDTNVELVGLECPGQDLKGFLFPPEAHVEEAETVAGPRQHRPQLGRLLVIPFGRVELPPFLQALGQLVIEDARLRVLLPDLLHQAIEAALILQ